ncbi:MAG: tetratricopeptide repeat protein [Candidatus Eutrophobiaceae bacterium]
MSIILLTSCDWKATDDPLTAFNSNDFKRSYELWKPLAEQGDVVAQNYLAIHYYLGLHGRRDLAAAAQWFTEAAQQGHPDAQRNLGTMYIEGQHMKQDAYTAYMWLFAAFQQGNERAIKQVDRIEGENKLSPNQILHAKVEANKYIIDPAHRFYSRDNYIDSDTQLSK